MYRVVIWETNQTLVETPHFSSAKRIARNQGHDGTGNGKYYNPVARVDEPMQDGSPGYGIVYNPRFVVGKHDNFRPIPFVQSIQPGPRKCSHGFFRGCSYGCN